MLEWRKTKIDEIEVANVGLVRSWIPKDGFERAESPYILEKRVWSGKNSVFCFDIRRMGFHNIHIDWLVATAFCPNPGGKHICLRHLDDDLSNDMAENLEWYTPENPYGRAVVAQNKMTEEKIWFANQGDCARFFDVTRPSICKALTCRTIDIRGWAITWQDYNHDVQSVKTVIAKNILDGREVIFKSQSDAARHLGVAQSHISACLKRQRKRVGEWTFYWSEL